MKLLAPAVLLSFTTVFFSAPGNAVSSWQGQEPPPAPPQSSTVPQQQQVPAPQPEMAPPEPTITVPAGTRLQLELARPIWGHSTHAGDPVRAATIAPVNVGQDLAIPEGAFVEGKIVKVGKRDATRFEGLVIEFKRLAFINGYTAEFDGSVIDATAIAPDTNPGGATAVPGLMANSLQQGPTPPPLPQVGPSKAIVIGATLGAFAATVVTLAMLGHRHIHERPRDFETGFQFEIVLQAPLTLNRARVANALGSSTSN